MTSVCEKGGGGGMPRIDEMNVDDLFVPRNVCCEMNEIGVIRRDDGRL